MGKIKYFSIGLAAILVVSLMALQSRSIQQLRSELAEVKQHVTGARPSGERPAREPGEMSSAPRGEAGFDQRLAELEKTVSSLNRASDYLMERGQLPMAESKIQDARGKFMDATQPDRERLRALELLRRNRGMNDEIASQALAWLQTSTNAGTQRAILQQMSGMTNAAWKQPLLQLAAAADPRVREEAVDNLRHFAGDPQIEALLWQTMKNDPIEDVRQQAEEALGRGPITPDRLAALQQRALASETSLDERLVAMEALDRAGADIGAVTAHLANVAATTTDPNERLKLFRAFDGMEDPALRLPLISGLQDPNPLVREEAVDALSGHIKSDPAIKEWLEYVAQNDSDPQVRREAFQALQD